MVYIERMFGNHSLGIRSELGKRAPLHSTALGKVIFANLPGEEREELLSQYILRPVTPFTITDKNELRNELKKIQITGFALDEQENEVGGRCIGAPIFDHSGYPIGAISISIPVQRFPLERTEDYGLRLKKTADEISERMGYLHR